MKSCASRDVGGNAFRRVPLISGGTAHHAAVEVQAEVLRSLAVQEWSSIVCHQ